MPFAISTKNKIILAVLAAAVIVGIIWLAGRKPAAPAGGQKKLSVVASFYPLAFFAQRIGGDKAAVINVTPAGAEPHDYEPTAQDVARIEDSDMLVLNGGGLEAWGENVKKNLNPQKNVVITVGEGLTTQQVEEDGQTITDPHIWLSPALAQRIVDAITGGYKEADPADAMYFQANADVLKAELVDLHAEYAHGLSSCVHKDIITSHAAFGYLATTYGLTQVPIAGLSPDAEPSPQQLADIAAFAKKNDVKYIFFESLVSPKLSETIAAEVGAKTLVLNPIEGLSRGELDHGKDYFTEMRSNLASLQTALQCQK